MEKFKQMKRCPKSWTESQPKDIHPRERPKFYSPVRLAFPFNFHVYCQLKAAASDTYSESSLFHSTYFYLAKEKQTRKKGSKG